MHRFVGTRDHWVPNTRDTGTPDSRGLRVSIAASDPQVVGPYTAFRAAEVTKIYIELAAHMANPGNKSAQLFWSAIGDTVAGDTFNATQSLNFTIIADGQYRVYELNVANHAHWTGLIKQLRLDPVTSGGAGDYIYLRSVSHRYPIPEPASIAAWGALSLLPMSRRRGHLFLYGTR